MLLSPTSIRPLPPPRRHVRRQFEKRRAVVLSARGGRDHRARSAGFGAWGLRAVADAVVTWKPAEHRPERIERRTGCVCCASADGEGSLVACRGTGEHSAPARPLLYVLFSLQVAAVGSAKMNTFSSSYTLPPTTKHNRTKSYSRLHPCRTAVPSDDECAAALCSVPSAAMLPITCV